MYHYRYKRNELIADTICKLIAGLCFGLGLIGVFIFILSTIWGWPFFMWQIGVSLASLMTIVGFVVVAVKNPVIKIISAVEDLEKES